MSNKKLTPQEVYDNYILTDKENVGFKNEINYNSDLDKIIQCLSPKIHNKLRLYDLEYAWIDSKYLDSPIYVYNIKPNLCTDTIVGTTIYVCKGMVLFVGVQSARKNQTFYQYVDEVTKELCEKLFENAIDKYILDNCENTEMYENNGFYEGELSEYYQLDSTNGYVHRYHKYGYFKQILNDNTLIYHKVLINNVNKPKGGWFNVFTYTFVDDMQGVNIDDINQDTDNLYFKIGAEYE